jgi:isoleucyl-tRNA synthetase
MQQFQDLPDTWRDDVLAAKWERIREIRRICTNRLEAMRAEGEIGSSLQAWVHVGLPEEDLSRLSDVDWAELLIVSLAEAIRYEDFQQRFETKHKRSFSENHPAAGLLDKPHGSHPVADAEKAPGQKCARCWRVLQEVGTVKAHPTLCLRCTDAVERA